MISQARIYDALQKVIPTSLCEPILYLEHYPVLTGHTKERPPYDTLQSEYYRAYMASDAYTSIPHCQSCAARDTKTRHQNLFRLFSGTGPLKFPAMNILGPISKMKPSNQHLVFLTIPYMEQMRAISVTTVASTSAATVLVDNWVFPYGAPTYQLSDSGPQLVSKFFDALTACLRIKHLTTTAHPPQTSGQVERFKRTIVARLQHYVAEH